MGFCIDVVQILEYVSSYGCPQEPLPMCSIVGFCSVSMDWVHSTVGDYPLLLSGSWAGIEITSTMHVSVYWTC